MDQKIKLPGLPQTSGKLIRSHRCETCKYGEKEPPQGVLFCHKLPPMVSIVPTNRGPQTMSSFPPVSPEQWCGAFEPKIGQVN